MKSYLDIIFYLILRLGMKSGISKLNPFAYNMWVIYEKGKPVNSLNKQIDKKLVYLYIYNRRFWTGYLNG
jgi:hypothetical protein